MREKGRNILVSVDAEKILEWIYLVVFVLWISYSFLITTTFELDWLSSFYENVRMCAIALILARVGYSKKYNLKETILVIGLCLVFSYAARRTGQTVLTDLLILILGAKGISFRKIMKIYIATITILFAFTIFSALTGGTENLIYNREGRRRSIAMGIAYPTDFSAHVFYLLLSYFYVRNERLKYIELGLAALLGILVFWITDGRTNFACILGAVAVFALYKIIRDRKIKQGLTYEMNGIFSGLLILSTTICGAFMIGLSILYSTDNRLLVLLDTALTSRLSLGHKGIAVYGFSLWGQNIPMIGLGGTTERAKYYFFLDSSYLSIVLQYGLIILATILLIWLLVGIKARRAHDWVLLLIIGIVAVQCMVEHHMIDVSYNPFFWALFGDLSTRQIGKSETEVL